MARPLKDIQDLIIERIADDNELVGLTCISQDKGDITTQIEEAVSGAESGIFVVVEILKGKRVDNKASADVEVALTIEEHVLLNRAQASPLTWDFVLMALWTLFGTPAGNANERTIILPETFELIGDTDGIVRAQIMARTKLRFERA